jgi:uncharacterized iron-regulated membrane protein
LASKAFRVAHKLHRSLGVIVAIQVLFWILGGLVMSAIPIEMVRGEHLAVKVLKQHPSHDYQYSIDRLLLRVEEPQQISFADLLGQPVYRIQGQQQTRLFDAVSGAELSPLNQQLVAQLAKAHYRGDGELIDVTQQGEWKASFDDALNTKLYFADDSGSLLRVRSDLWHFYDFFWMLHIMDYDEAEDFNNPLLIFFAACSLLFVFSGLILLSHYIRRKLLHTS